jgi:leucyl aminopeptidase
VPIAVPTSDDSAPAEERPGSAGYQVGRDQRAAAAGASALDDYLPVGVVEILASSETTGRPGEITQAVARLGQATVTVLFLGVGDRAPAALRRAGAALGRRMRGRGTAVTTAVTGEPDAAVQAFVEGVLLGSYTFDMKSGDRDGEAPADINLLATDAGQADVLRRASVMAGAVALARDLGNTPSAVKSPAWLAARAAEIAGERGLDSRVWTEAELAAGGFGGLLAVGSGSARPPRLIQLSYRPQRAAAHVVLVGKGITFDSGGLSLKPNDNMKLMKTDMVGGAAVIAAMSALAELGVQVRVTGLIAAAENMPSGSALRIGDVICHFGGKTVEVLNTDAEGRLVLADALAYADASLDPDLVVDLATLTGAARVALGSVMAALYATDDGLAAALLEAGSASGDRLWRMPLADDYRDALESSVADLANVARGSGRAGSIDAALFLREFTGDRAWAHLDIAGAARATADDGENTKGATGFGTRLLLRWLTRDWPLAQ